LGNSREFLLFALWIAPLYVCTQRHGVSMTLIISFMMSENWFSGLCKHGCLTLSSSKSRCLHSALCWSMLYLKQAQAVQFPPEWSWSFFWLFEILCTWNIIL
jgi:hypothetical protein